MSESNHKAPRVSPEFLDIIESLGDNCELGFYLRENKLETGSLFRWALCPIDSVTAYINRTESREAFAFEDLKSSSPGMVVDVSTGIRFHSGMRSVEAGDGFEFELDEAARRDIYVNEKAKHDHLLEKFEAGLNSDAKRVYVIKANDDLNADDVRNLHEAIANHKALKDFLLVVVFEHREKARLCQLDWQSESLVYGYVDRFADYLAAFDIDTESWDRLMMEISSSEKITAWLRETIDDEERQAKHIDVTERSIPLSWFKQLLNAELTNALNPSKTFVELPESIAVADQYLIVHTHCDSRATDFDNAFVLHKVESSGLCHTMTQKLPNLFAYTLLNLDCPIVSRNPITDIENYIGSLLGIDMDSVVVDEPGELSINTAILPEADAIADVCFNAVSTLDHGESPFGEKIFIERSKGAVTQLDNQEAIHAEMIAVGFDVVNFEKSASRSLLTPRSSLAVTVKSWPIWCSIMIVRSLNSYPINLPLSFLSS